MRTRILSLPLLLLPTLFASCAADFSSRETKAPARSDSDNPEDKAELAALEMDLAAAKVAGDAHTVESAVVNAEWELAMAEANLAKFVEVDGVSAVQKAKLSQARARFSLATAEAGFEELTAMYDEEEFAVATKSLVIERARMGIEFAKQQLEISNRDLSSAQQGAAHQQNKLELAVAKAQQQLEGARMKMERQGVEARIALMKAEQKLESVQTSVDG